MTLHQDHQVLSRNRVSPEHVCKMWVAARRSGGWWRWVGHTGEGSIRKRRDETREARIDLGRGPDGKRRQRSVYAKTSKAVAQRLAELRAQSISGDAPATGRMTVGEYLDRWLVDGLGGVQPSTRENYERTVRLHLKPQLGRTRMARLSPIQVQRACAAISQARTRQLSHAVLHRALNQAVRWQLISRNPAALVDKPRTRAKEVNEPTLEQMRRLLAAAKGDPFEALYNLACHTGMRQSELLGLKWRDVDIDGRALSVRRAVVEVSGRPTLRPPKTRKGERRIELPRTCVAALRAHRSRLRATPHGEVLVFSDSKGGPIRRQNFTRRHWWPMREEARLGQMRFHDLRHGAATLLVSMGVHPKVCRSD